MCGTEYVGSPTRLILVYTWHANLPASASEDMLMLCGTLSWNVLGPEKEGGQTVEGQGVIVCAPIPLRPSMSKTLN